MTMETLFSGLRKSRFSATNVLTIFAQRSTTISYAIHKCTNMKFRQKVVRLWKFNWRLEQWTLEQHQMLLAQNKEPEQVDCDRSFRF